MSAIQAELYPEGKIVPTATWGLMELGGGLQDRSRFSPDIPQDQGPELSVT